VARPAPTDPHADARWSSERYLALLTEGILRPDDRVELLQGVIVAMAPSNPRHASCISRVVHTLVAAVAGHAVVRPQLPFVAGPYSVPEPDVAVVPGQLADYDAVHPATALLIIEVSDVSLVQDRMTKAPIYAAAGVPEYWILNLRDDRLEVFRDPDPKAARYRETLSVRRGEQVTLVALQGASVAVDDLLPGR
jgi:Uma2 family endonuclease